MLTSIVTFFDHLFFFLTHKAESIFWISALFGTALFLLKVLTFTLGNMHEDSFENDLHEPSIDSDLCEDVHTSTKAFKFLSFHSLSGFFMMFGWMGLAGLKQFHTGPLGAALLGIGAGLLLMLVTALFFRKAMDLASDGTQFTINKAIGLSGTVYQQIPSRGIGKIHVVVDGITREILAVSHDENIIPSFSPIKVIKNLDDTVVIVEKISEQTNTIKKI